MNWVIKFNQLEKEGTDKLIDIIAEYQKYEEDLFDNIYTKLYDLKQSIDIIINKLSRNIIVDNLKLEAEKLTGIFDEIRHEHEEKTYEVIKQMFDYKVDILEVSDDMYDVIRKYTKNKKDLFLAEKRLEAFERKASKMYWSMQMDPMIYERILFEIYDNLQIIEEIIQTKNDEALEEASLIEKLNKNQKKDYLKIFDYKDMLDLAEKNGYKQVRQTGDHIIMQHKKSNKIVPIPAHELKYGLMLQIQKQIEVNKIS